MSQILDDIDSKKKVTYPGKLAGLSYKIDLANEAIKRTQIFLFLIVAINILFLFFLVAEYGIKKLYLGHIMYTVSIIFFTLFGFISFKKPLVGISLAIAFYLVFHIALYLLYDQSILSNYIAKGVTVFFLISGFWNCWKANRLKEELSTKMNQVIIAENLTQKKL